MLVVEVRSFLTRHRHVRRTAIALLAATAGAVLAVQSHRLDEARRSWAERREVWVADQALAPGQPVLARRVELPLAAVPDGAVVDVAELVAVQYVGVGEVITAVDARESVARLAPAGWRTVAVPVGQGTVPLAPGNRVDVVADGSVIAADGIVIGAAASDADAVGAGSGVASGGLSGVPVVVVAVRAADAALVAAAAHDQRADLIGRP